MTRPVQVGASGGEAYLLMTDQKTALVDTGFAYCAPVMIQNIKNALGGRDLDFILLTHSHYDHVSGAPYCKDVWKNCKIVCSEYAANVFTRPGALKLMAQLNETAAEIAGVKEYEPSVSKIAADIAVKDGDTVDMGDMKLRVLEMPGHTKCSTGYFEENEKLLIGCETLGVCVPPDKDVIPCFLVSCESSIKAIKRALELKPDKLIITPYGYMEGEEPARVLNLAVTRAVEMREFVTARHRCGISEAGIARELKDKIYTERYAKYQPEGAFMLNTEIMVELLIKEYSDR
ncbi:MAG: MBL fold metallo-hydrolase [Oscillospiraceae bacterium]|nr:MBL fold metallo-hydrolase [Oscillospiraceae bacterium]